VSFDVLGCGMASKIPTSYLAQPFDRAAFASEPSPMGAISMDDLRDQVADVIRAVAAVDGPVVVLAHSISGAILGAVAELLPEAIKRMVYIGAFVPTKFPSA
jgi:pimeloyl-ACP methyl ester carboxylesterase